MYSSNLTYYIILALLLALYRCFLERFTFSRGYARMYKSLWVNDLMTWIKHGAIMGAITCLYVALRLISSSKDFNQLMLSPVILIPLGIYFACVIIAHTAAIVRWGTAKACIGTPLRFSDIFGIYGPCTFTVRDYIKDDETSLNGSVLIYIKGRLLFMRTDVYDFEVGQEYQVNSSNEADLTKK